MKYAEAAEKFATAIRSLANNPDNLNNLESYLTQHFDKWLVKYANTPDGIVSELESFAKIYD